MGWRLLSPCDVPDLTLLPAHYPGRPSVRFGAGLELAALHLGMNAMALLAKWGLVRNWSVHARWLKRSSDWFRTWGSDAGAMHVSVRGLDARGGGARQRWTLIATHCDGARMCPRWPPPRWCAGWPRAHRRPPVHAPASAC